MRRQTFFEQISIDGLGRRGALSGGDDHLTIGRRDAPRSEQSRHAGAELIIHLDLARSIRFCSHGSRQLIVKNVAPRREQRINAHNLPIGKD